MATVTAEAALGGYVPDVATAEVSVVPVYDRDPGRAQQVFQGLGHFVKWFAGFGGETPGVGREQRVNVNKFTFPHPLPDTWFNPGEVPAPPAT